MDRKGQEEGGSPVSLVVAVLVVAMIVLILFTVIIPKVGEIGEKKFSDAQCTASLVATQVRDLPAVCLKKQTEVIPLLCTRRFLTVTDAGVTMDGEEPNEKDQYQKYSSSCPEGVSASGSCLAHNVLAQEMRHCWDTFSRGEMIVFQQGENNPGAFWEVDDGKARSCFVCSEVTLKTSKDVEGFSSYLKGATFTDGTTQSNFYDHIARNPRAFCDPDLKSPTCYEGIANELANKVDLDKLPKDAVYAVTFVRRGNAMCESTSAGDKRKLLTFTVEVIPADRISQQCKTVFA